MPRQTHPISIKQKRKRRQSFKILREKYKLAKTDAEKQKILDKVKRINHCLTENEFLLVK